MAGDTRENKTYHGVIVPMVTPLNDKGELDEPAARRIIDHLVAGGVQGIFVLGTTGEFASMPREMRVRLVHLTIEHTGARAQVYAGIGDTVVEESINAARDYLKRGATAVVAQLPNYFQLTPDEQFQYFALLANRVRGPILLYDIPATIHMRIDDGVIEHLRAFTNVVGIKDSTGDRERMTGLLDSYGDDPGFTVLVGSQPLAAFGLTNGADGFIPSGGNLNPGLCSRLYAAALTGDSTLVASLQKEIDALVADYAVDGYSEYGIGRSVARLKRRMAQRGLCGPNVLPPLGKDEEQANRQA